MLRYKSDLLVDANNGQGKVIFRASKIECPCVITSPNIEQISARLEALAAVVGSSSTPTAAPGDAVVFIPPQDAQALERLRSDIATLLARQDALDAARVQLEDKLTTSLAKPSSSPTNTIVNARLNTLADDVARLTSAIERIERRLSLAEAGQPRAVQVLSEPEAAPSASAAAEAAPVVVDSVDAKRITTPDGRVITLRRTPPTGKTVQYAW